MNESTSKLIVYACPVGVLAEQLDAYYAEALRQCGQNKAHQYPAHCTLTGFFHDDLEAEPIYAAALAGALEESRDTRPERIVAVNGMVLEGDFHYLSLKSPWLESLAARFAATVHSPTRRDSLRLKSDLHLSLAYEFPPQQSATLAQIAKELVNPQAPAHWELRLYQQHPDKSWTCHASLAMCHNRGA